MNPAGNDDSPVVLLVDAENVIGPSKPRVPLVRSRIQALLSAAGQVHHAIVAFGHDWPADDTVTSVLAELGVVPWPVPPGPDAAEIALSNHARYLATRGRRWRFLVASGDHRLAQVAEYGDLRVLVWVDHPLANKLQSAAAAVYRLPKPSATNGSAPAARHMAAQPQQRASPTGHRSAPRFSEQLVTAIATGVGIAVGQRLLDAVLPRRKPR